MMWIIFYEQSICQQLQIINNKLQKKVPMSISPSCIEFAYVKKKEFHWNESGANRDV